MQYFKKVKFRWYCAALGRWNFEFHEEAVKKDSKFLAPFFRMIIICQILDGIRYSPEKAVFN